MLQMPGPAMMSPKNLAEAHRVLGLVWSLGTNWRLCVSFFADICGVLSLHGTQFVKWASLSLRVCSSQSICVEKSSCGRHKQLREYVVD